MDSQTRRKRKLKTKGGQIDLLHVLAKAAGQIWVQHAPRDNALSYRALGGLLRRNPSKVIAQTHFQGFVQGEWERLVGGRAGTRAALKWACLRQTGNGRSQYADHQEEEAKPGNSHEYRSILQELPAAPAALGIPEPRGRQGGSSDYAITACGAEDTQVRDMHVCILSSYAHE